MKVIVRISIAALFLAAVPAMQAAQLSTNARPSVPHDVQQLVVIDYRTMQESPTAMALRERVMPPDLKQFDEALSKSGLNDNHDVDALAFALFRPHETGKDASDDVMTVGIAQGQFPVQDMMATFRKQKVKPAMVRTNKVFPMGKTGMVLCFVDASTMVFGAKDAVTDSLDARDGIASNLLTNAPMMDAMRTVDSEPLWSILDQKGTQTMMKQVLGDAGSVTDYDAVRKRMQGSWYSLNFQHGVKFDMTLATGDVITAAAVSTLLSAAITVRKASASDAEKQALTDTSIASDAGKLSIHFSSTDKEFTGLLQSPLFQSMVH